jgi:hypothetical protein
VRKARSRESVVRSEADREGNHRGGSRKRKADGTAPDTDRVARVVVRRSAVQPGEGSNLVVAERSRQSSPAAVHEAAHELVALKFGCRDVHAFVRSPESGICYHRLPPAQRWDLSIGKWRTDDLARVRARAAVSMAGEIAEAMLDGLPVPDHEALLTQESADPAFEEFGFEYGSLEEVFNHTVSVFGDHKVAARWMKAALPAVRSKTLRVLQENWGRLLRRAAELDGSLIKRDAA